MWARRSQYGVSSPFVEAQIGREGQIDLICHNNGSFFQGTEMLEGGNGTASRVCLDDVGECPNRRGAICVAGGWTGTDMQGEKGAYIVWLSIIRCPSSEGANLGHAEPEQTLDSILDNILDSILDGSSIRLPSIASVQP